MKQRLKAKLTTLLQQVPIVRHLSRQKFIAQFVIGLIKSRNVQFGEVAQHLNDHVKVASNETRIQDFFREVTLDYGLLAHLLLTLLPATGKLRLCLDRTEWDFGQCQVNILLITVGQGAFQLPLYWELLDNRSGNSSAADRIALLQTCVQVLGKHRIGLVLGDREFVGHVWLKWLQDNGLNFVMRLPKHHQLTYANGRRAAVTDLGLAVGQVRRFAHVQADGVWGQVWVKALAEGEFLFLFGTVGRPYMDQLYAKRWTIEQCFQNLKGRGFNLEASHLRCRHKLRKLVALVSLAYALCLSVGTVAHAKRAPIARKNHGYRATSLSRHGLNILRQLTRPATSPHEPMARMVEALMRWISWKITHYQTTKIVG
ncbi:IS4 family transposase [Hymenobacter sp. NST-14]|uniref:IS4 family transposase n=1 Tax=Hymenobacter piscis TaxID=2839984 RepID=UPI001C01B641|nr:IS4 family transposase [Hymenobacter piscis]MBT9394871.1 IS4 family transposase [Hymenobacter piscis]